MQGLYPSVHATRPQCSPPDEQLNRGQENEQESKALSSSSAGVQLFQGNQWPRVPCRLGHKNRDFSFLIIDNVRKKDTAIKLAVQCFNRSLRACSKSIENGDEATISTHLVMICTDHQCHNHGVKTSGDGCRCVIENCDGTTESTTECKMPNEVHLKCTQPLDKILRGAPPRKLSIVATAVVAQPGMKVGQKPHSSAQSPLIVSFQN